MRTSKEVGQALNDGTPVVALESTIVAHGMPRPTNIETALAVESIIRDQGAIPASVGLIEGEIVCGLSASELEFLAYSDDVIKAQERDLARATVTGRSGATTVGATLFVAAHFGIRVHVTGGIGGVAPDFDETLDISADLLAISRYPCITVASGTKAFMDIGATLEYLETIGVPVGSWTESTFPWFYSRDSGIKVEWKVDSPEQVVDAFLADQQLRGASGMLLGVPLPLEDALPEEWTRAVIDEALACASAEGISGKPLTPYLLAKIFEITEGESLAANVALIKNNASVGARIATSLAAR
jgi:pseudouridine-5'-phosphate glycosidase